jgi:16S rRNA (cytosine967-C5)-methyltransferase
VSVAPARRIALKVLKRVREREAFGSETLDAVLGAAGLSPADTALATRLTYGTLQTLGVLDEAIDRFADKPSQIEPAVRDALRLAAYELLYARTPARAVVNEGVEAVKALRPQAAGLANAVLRRLAREAESFPWGDPDTDDEALARATAHPKWLVDLWIAELGREKATEVLRADGEPAPLYLWHNPFRGSPIEGLDVLEADGAQPRACDPEGCIVAGVPSAAVRGNAVREGRFLVADAAAQLAARALAPRPGSVVVDLAAGRGTKTAQIQSLAVTAGGPCDLLAMDVHEFKADVLRRRMADLGVPDVTVLVGDATCLSTVPGLPAAHEADAVLLDAPCSGLGTLRRRADKRWRLTPDDIERLAQLQATMLVQAASLVRSGGVVVYSTCSISRRENHEVVAGFLDSPEGGPFEVADLGYAVPHAWGSWIGEEGFFQSLPAAGGPDGHFVALLKRTG